MEPTASAACRDLLDRLRAQVHAHLPPISHGYNGPEPIQVVPLDRLPMIGQLVQQLIEAEAVFAQANASADQQPDA